MNRRSYNNQQTHHWTYLDIHLLTTTPLFCISNPCYLTLLCLLHKHNKMLVEVLKKQLVSLTFKLKASLDKVLSTVILLTKAGGLELFLKFDLYVILRIKIRFKCRTIFVLSIKSTISVQQKWASGMLVSLAAMAIVFTCALLTVFGKMLSSVEQSCM